MTRIQLGIEKLAYSSLPDTLPKPFSYMQNEVD